MDVEEDTRVDMVASARKACGLQRASRGKEATEKERARRRGMSRYLEGHRQQTG